MLKIMDGPLVFVFVSNSKADHLMLGLHIALQWLDRYIEVSAALPPYSQLHNFLQYKDR